MKLGTSFSRQVFLGSMACLCLFCKQPPHDDDGREGNVAKEIRPFTPANASLNPDLQDALQAFSLDSVDARVLQDWSACRKVSPSRGGGTLARWMAENYWPLQSIGLRLAELAQLELEKNLPDSALAKAQMDSVTLIAGDLSEFLQDALLQTHVQKIRNLDRIDKSARTGIILSFLRGREQTLQQDYNLASSTLLQAQWAALQLGDSLSAAEIGLSLLDVHIAKEEYAAVLQDGEKCTALAGQIGYRWLQAQALNKIADAERILGYDEHAMACAGKALHIAELLRDRRTQRDCHLYRARIFYDAEKYREAEVELQEVAVRDAEHLYQGDILLLQGQMHLDRGEYGLAQEYLERAVAEFERNRNVANVAVVYGTLSLLHMEQGDEQNALATEGKALAIHEREWNTRRIAWSHMNLGLIHARFNNLAAAEAALAQAIARMHEQGEPRVLAQALVLQGNLQLQQKNFALAARTFADAMARSQRVGFQYGRAGALIGLARLASAENAAAAADSQLAAAEKIAHELREPHLLTEVLFRRGLLHRQKQSAPAALHFLEQAIAVLEQRFHSIARDSSRMQFFAPAQEIFDEAILLALTLRQDERALQFSERARARALLESLGSASRDRSMAIAPAAFSAGQIRQNLPEQCSIIVYRATADTLVSWAITKDKFLCRRLPLSQDSLSNAVQKFSRSIGAVETAGFRTRVLQNPVAVYQENRRLGRELFRAVLEPWVHEINDSRVIYFIPDGALHRVPFGALVTSRDRFLEEESALVRVPSLAILYQGLRSPRTIPEVVNHRLLIVSNPAGDFPAAGEEKTRLAQLFARHRILQRERASFAAVREELRGGVDILHLSVHALADPVRPLNSYLELSTPSASNAFPRTERVFARQLLEMELSSVWLTVLNGCETASGRIVHGEGALSLVRLFAVQRVAVMVATLWKNDDWQSLPLVDAFYRELAAGADPAQALHRSKVEAIAELLKRSPERVALPYFWAVFEMYMNQQVVRGPA
jgi:CHAT domain-containing protein